MTRQSSLGILAAVVFGTTPFGAAHAQQPAYAAATPGDTAIDVTLVRVIDGARSRGIPAEPLLAKVREGKLKRAATPRIRNALAALVTRLDSARVGLGPTASADELIAGADALAAGADVAALRAVRTASAGRSASASLGALAQLVASGVPSPRAVSMVIELLRRNASAAQVLAFGNLVESDVVSGLPAEESAVLRLHSFGSATSSPTMGVTDSPLSTPANLGSASSPPPPTPPRSTTPKRRP